MTEEGETGDFCTVGQASDTCKMARPHPILYQARRQEKCKAHAVSAVAKQEIQGVKHYICRLQTYLYLYVYIFGKSSSTFRPLTVHPVGKEGQVVIAPAHCLI